MPEISAPPPVRQVYEFGEFRLDAAKRLLSRRDGIAVPLTPRVFDTLLFMVQHAHAVLDKERLMEAVWADAIVEENNLSQNISTLRRVLGDKPGANRFIATVPGRGYRFVADVKAVDSEAAERPVEPTPQAAREAQPPSGRRSRAIQLGAAAALLLLLAAGTFVWSRISPARKNSAAPIAREKGVAVLPFENLSAEPADAFLADGMQDDVLTSVGKIRDLKVIARASVMDYRGARLAGKVREIGDTLGVSHVLEGSVRRAGDRVVVNAALIDTRDERQVWSERYERSLTNTLSLQGELALEIGRALRATLTPNENSTAAAKPTSDADAYLLYLRGREADSRGEYQQSSAFYEQAIARDPQFALARARFAITGMSRNYETGDEALRARIRHEAEEALRLRPNLGEGHLALALCYLNQERDPARALASLERAAEFLPNSAEVHLARAFVYKQQKRFRDRIAALHQAESIDPRDPSVRNFLVLTLRWVRDWPGAMQALDRRAVLRPGPAFLVSPWSRANDEFRLSGNIDVLRKAIASERAGGAADERLNYARFEVAMLERDFADAARFLAAIPAEALPPNEQSLLMASRHAKAFHLALLSVAAGEARTVQLQNIADAEQEIRARLELKQADTSRAQLLADLAVLQALAGRKEEAIRAATEAVALKPEISSWIERNEMSSALALVYAHVGEPDEAIELIQHLLTVPVNLQAGAVYNMTLRDLQWRWVWDPLRAHPAFQKLVSGPEPATRY